MLATLLGCIHVPTILSKISHSSQRPGTVLDFGQAQETRSSQEDDRKGTRRLGRRNSHQTKMLPQHFTV